MANISMDPRATNYLRQNIVFSYPEMIRVSFSLFLCLSVFCYFTLLLIFTKIVFLLLLLFFFFMKIIFIFACSGMFRYVPACSRMFHVPDFIDGRSLLRISFLFFGNNVCEIKIAFGGRSTQKLFISVLCSFVICVSNILTNELLVHLSLF